MRIAVIGAGWAGCTAAVDLARRGHAVTVFEAGAVPGGRARRVVRSGLPLDNGQHLLLGAYEATRRALAIVHGAEVPPRRPRPAPAGDPSARPGARRARVAIARCGPARPRAGAAVRTGTADRRAVAARRLVHPPRARRLPVPVRGHRGGPHRRMPTGRDALAVGAAVHRRAQYPARAGLGTGVRERAARGVRRPGGRERLPRGDDRPVRALSGRRAAQRRGGRGRGGVALRRRGSPRCRTITSPSPCAMASAASMRPWSPSARTRSRACSPIIRRSTMCVAPRAGSPTSRSRPPGWATRRAARCPRRCCASTTRRGSGCSTVPTSWPVPSPTPRAPTLRSSCPSS